MTSRENSKVISAGFGRTNRWLGSSGRSYELISENLATFSVEDSALYLLAKGTLVLWVGSTGELVGDHLSRARFRLALGCADRVFRLASTGQDAERLSIISDLEGGVVPATIAAAA